MTSSKALPIRSRISLAAALVKVTTRKRSIFSCPSGPVIRWINRSTSTAVLPEPAAAATKIWPLNVMAARCSAVQLGLLT